MGTLSRDLRYALRVLRKAPAFTLTAVLTLAVAIGINTAVFSAVDAVLLRPLPYPDPDRLYLLEARTESGGTRATRTSQHGFAWAVLRDYATTVDRAVFSTWRSGVNVIAGGQATHADQQKIGAGFFAVLGTPPLLGREFTAAEDRRGGPAAVILSHHFWRAHLGGDPSAIGRPLSLRGEPHTIVGVMPPGVQTGVEADLWTPLRPSTDGEGAGENYQIVLRVPEGTPMAAVEAELSRLGPEINRASPPPDNVSITYGAVPLQQGLTNALRRPLLMLWIAVGIVLLIACVNLAGLLLARGARRTHEIATRLALGSSRLGIVRQLLVENLVLAAAGTIVGLGLGAVALEELRDLAVDALGLWQPIALETRTVMAAGALALLSTALFGALPALLTTRTTAALTPGTRTVAGARSHHTRRILITAQVALGVVLLVGAGLLLRTFAHLRGLDAGFDGRGVYAASVSLQDARYGTGADVRHLVTATLERLDSSTGVDRAAISLGLPYERLLNLAFAHADGTEADAGPRMTSATYIAGDYFGTLRIPVRAGRPFDPARDSNGSAPVAIVNETLAREYFGGRTPLGRRIRIAGAEREIVGMVGDVQVRPGFGDRGPLAPMPLVYIPLAQANDGFLRLVHGWFATSVLIRANGSIDAAAVLRAAIDAVDPLLPFADVRSMSQVQAKAIALPRLLSVLLASLALAAVALTAVGLHGLIASSVAERTRELGIRLALGASTTRAIATVALPGIVLTIIGVTVGAAAARGGTQLLQSFVWGVSPTDPLTYAAVAFLLLAIASAASIVPALRISRIDPAGVLRGD